MEAKALAETQQQYTRVKRSDLLSRLEEARDIHIKAYEEALEGWQVKYVRSLKEASEAYAAAAAKAEEDANLSEAEPPYLDIPVAPVSHEETYTEVITRYQMSIDEEIWLSHKDFNQFIMDKWHWKGSFLDSVGTYASAATRESVARGRR